jgi:hypothetical protein
MVLLDGAIDTPEAAASGRAEKWRGDPAVHDQAREDVSQLVQALSAQKVIREVDRERGGVDVKLLHEFVTAHLGDGDKRFVQFLRADQGGQCHAVSSYR